MSDLPKLDSKRIITKLGDFLSSLKRYELILFLVFVGIVYGYIILQISSLTNAQPSPEAVASQIQASQTPHLDKTVVNQLESLQDNSVNVQTLFDSARSNPFQ